MTVALLLQSCPPPLCESFRGSVMEEQSVFRRRGLHRTAFGYRPVLVRSAAVRDWAGDPGRLTISVSAHFFPQPERIQMCRALHDEPLNEIALLKGPEASGSLAARPEACRYLRFFLQCRNGRIQPTLVRLQFPTSLDPSADDTHIARV